MKQNELQNLYDRDYAQHYNDAFLVGEQFRSCTEYERELLTQLMTPNTRWLDVACGTGYFLSRFPTIERAGLDISRSMLEVARRANPDVSFYERDFRQPAPDLAQQWSVVTCMWYAYCYVESLQEIANLVENLADWTSADGTCFMPLCDPEWLCGTHLPYMVAPEKTSGGRLRIDAVVWNWTDDLCGKEHKGLVAPQVELMRRLFAEHFEDITISKYPTFTGDWMNGRLALTARKKRAGN